MKRIFLPALTAGMLVTQTIALVARADEPKGPAPAAAGEKSPPGPAQPAPSQQVEDPRDRQIEALNQIILELRRRVEALEKRSAAAPTGVVLPATAPGPEPAAEPPPVPEQPAPEAAPTATPGAATLLPNVSILGRATFLGSDSKGTAGRGRFNLNEVEVAIQDRVAPNLRGDFFLSAEKEEEWKTAVEEGYLTYSNLLGLTGVSARFGKLRAPFGKLNPMHPHSWRFVNQPSVITAFLGPDGLNADGATLQYLLPWRGIFANLEIGRWQTTSATEGGRGFGGTDHNAWSGRFWLGREIGRDRELELGFSRYQGRGQPEGLDQETRLAINGVDLTFRAFPSAYRRLLVQAEAVQHHTSRPSRSRYGGYLNAALQLNQYWEFGARGDYTRFPFPVGGHESGVSAYLTRYLTEQTSVRLQLKHGSRPEDGTFNEVFVQFLFGAGPHFHLLQ